METTTDTRRTFMIVLKGDHAQWPKASQTRRDEVMQLYRAWVGKLHHENRFVGGHQLGSESRRLKGVPGNIVVDGPFPESKEALTGYFLVHAESLDEAVEVAKGCPALLHGDFVEVLETS